jgi:hypothetical protein
VKIYDLDPHRSEARTTLTILHMLKYLPHFTREALVDFLRSSGGFSAPPQLNILHLFMEKPIDIRVKGPSHASKTDQNCPYVVMYQG